MRVNRLQGLTPSEKEEVVKKVYARDTDYTVRLRDEGGNILSTRAPCNQRKQVPMKRAIMKRILAEGVITMFRGKGCCKNIRWTNIPTVDGFLLPEH